MRTLTSAIGRPTVPTLLRARIIRADHRRSFRQAISLIDRHAHGPEKFRELAGKRPAAGNECAEPAADAFANF